MADSSTSSAVDLTESLILSLNRLRNYDRYTLSLLNLVACDGSYAFGVPFTSSSVIVRHLRTMMKVSSANSALFTPYFSFLEIFSTGYDILCRYVYRNEKPRDDTEDYRVLDRLLDFLMNIKGNLQLIIAHCTAIYCPVH
ncbi:hypothetical protein FSP39_021620 [Pinctada imbricata]|uniref:Uncharacterized protein n=1 Tax=Pinctada imbricata TaxID=66713 RepID=A0AA88XXV0_PINIB|nr:hypothetical protein FSP39_021620 [Pinctada imbricata]